MRIGIDFDGVMNNLPEVWVQECNKNSSSKRENRGSKVLGNV